MQDTLDERINTDIAMLLDRFNSATLIPYEGEYISAENSYLGMTSGMEIQGQTFHNLARLDLDSSELFGSDISQTLVDGNIIATYESTKSYYKYNFARYKPNTKYTVVFNMTENSLGEKFTLLTESSSAILSIGAIDKVIVSSGQTGMIKTTITTASDLTGRSYVFPTGLSTATSGSITYSVAILEGDYTNVDLPDELNDIESVSGNLIINSNDLEQNIDQITYENIELRRINNIYDSSCDNQLTQRIGIRAYLEGDLELENVLVDNDLTTTYYNFR